MGRLYPRIQIKGFVNRCAPGKGIKPTREIQQPFIKQALLPIQTSRKKTLFSQVQPKRSKLWSDFTLT